MTSKPEIDFIEGPPPADLVITDIVVPTLVHVSHKLV